MLWPACASLLARIVVFISFYCSLVTMSKFWSFVTVVFIIAVALVVVDKNQDTITFTDLETECRYDRGEEAVINLNQDDSLGFSGHYPISGTSAELSLDYSRGQGYVALDVRARNVREVVNFSQSCRGSVIYDAKTRSLEPGEYLVTLRHNGETVNQQLIAVR